MSETPRPIEETDSTIPATLPLESRGASASEPGLTGCAETVSTLVHEPGRAPEDVPTRIIAEAGDAAPVDGTDSLTFQVAPRADSDSFPDDTESEPPPRLAHVAGYKILSVLGQGGMGVVYKARQRGLKRIVALKMISPVGHHGPTDLARFRSEAVAVADLQHPNIVQLYEVGEDNGHPFFSLEYVRGGSLARKISGTPQPPREAAELVRALADGMEYAHQRGIIHRDLKPANVLLTESGQPKVSDFGLVKRLEDDSGQTQSGSILGSASYMAPEQAEGKNKEIGPRCDIYALGGILYELLTGRPPFRAASVLDTLEQVRKQDPIPPSQFQTKVPRDLETICLKCLQKEPAKRYATAGEMGEDLRRFLSGEAILARPVSRVEWLWRWCRRNPRVAVLSGVVAILVMGWTATSTLLYRLARTNERTARANAERASQNAALAERNAREARSKAEEALANAETARRNAERASASEALARNQQRGAQGIAQDAIGHMIHLGEQVMRRLRAKHDPAQTEAEWVRLRGDLLSMLQKEIVPLAERIEGQSVSPFAFATFHQRLGDLLRKLGEPEDARRSYQQAYDRIAKVAHDQPNNDKARANLGVMLMLLGDLALDQGGDAARARDEFGRAWKLQEEVSLHPRSGNYTKADNHRILSGIALKQGIAELYLGLPGLARERFEQALEHRQAWTEVEPANVSAESFLSEAETWLGVAFSHSGDWENARRHLDAALEICETLADRYPQHLSFKGDLASVHGEEGAALGRTGRDEEAEKALNESLSYSHEVLARDPENTAQRLVTAQDSEGLASLAQKRGKHNDAVRLWRVGLEIRSDLAQLETHNVPAQAALAVALAHSGRTDEALKKAEELLKSNADRPAVLLPLARCFAACAVGGTNDADRRRAKALALDALSAAIGNGYRDPIAIRTEADFSQLLSEPMFQKLVDGIKDHEGNAP
jgi:serine/threonine-protein kinase